MIININEGKVTAVVGEDEFVLFEQGKQTKAKVEKAHETLGKLVKYEAAVDKARAEMAGAPKKKAPRKKKDPEPKVDNYEVVNETFLEEEQPLEIVQPEMPYTA